MFLSLKELEDLTGYTRPSAQARALREKWGIHPFISATGKVHVTKDIVEEAQRRMSGIEARSTRRRGPRPNLNAVS